MPTFAEPNWSAARDAAAAIVAPWNETDGPGGAIAVFDADGLRLALCGGREAPAGGAPFGLDTVVRYASVTKHVFAGLLVSRPDLVGLDDRLGDHLPELRGELAEVRVGRALDMSSGLPDVRDTLAILGLGVTAVSEAEPILAALGRIERLNYPYGSEISYSNTGYRLVEAALARRGLPFAEGMRRAFAEPLGLDWHAPEVWADPVPGLAPGWWMGPAGWQLGYAGLHLSASGSLAGSLASLVRWLRALLADETPVAGVVARLSAPRRLADGRETGYGLGIARTVIDGHTFIGHGGSHVGYKTNFLLDPERRLGVAVVSNREDTLAADAGRAVMAALLGLARPSRPHGLPQGFWVAAEGPEWLEVTADGVTFIGASEALWGEDDGTAVSVSSTLPIALRFDGEAIVGEIGHARRRFLPARHDETTAAIAGAWVSEEFAARFEITGDRFVAGVGPARSETPIVALGGGRFLVEGHDGPWTKRFVLATEGDRLVGVIHRSRVLRFRRA
jgi:CubicO group peptidase (beta-lactamase class C family)